MRQVTLDHGSQPITIEVHPDSIVVTPPKPRPAPSLEVALETALETPIESPSLSSLATTARRILVIVSDQSRDEPRVAMLNAIRARLPRQAQVRVAIANGTHEPRSLVQLALPSWAQPAINHDSRDPSNIVEMGTTSRGTPLRVNRALRDCDLVVAAGAIRPHYFAGYGGGVKALFPGLGENDAIRLNHRLKAASGASLGSVEDNPCRADLEEILAFLPARTFLLNVVPDVHGEVQLGVAGDMVAAHRVGCQRSRALHQVEAPRSRRLVLAHGGATSRSLYQACKLLAAAAPLALPGATLIVAADCSEGVGGDFAVVNDAIFELGIRPRLPTQHQVIVVAPTLKKYEERLFCQVRESFGELLEEPALIVPHSAGSLLFDVQV